MKAKKSLVKIMMLAMVCLLIQSSALCAADWMNISGTVYYNGQPLSVMVLANGQYTFTDGTDGRYDLYVPLDGNGQITLFSFCDGLAPFKVTLNSWEAGYYAINMSAADPGSQSMSITAARSASATSGWVRLIGNVRSGNGTALCAMVLANGQQIFSCDGNGSYSLDVPVDSEGNVTLFGFCDGLQPYKQIIHIDDDDEYSLGDTGKPADYDQSVLDFSIFDDFDSYADQLPPQLDWRERGVVTPAKDQENCGSCWAFTAVGVMESKIKINGGSLYDLSEQQQVSCNMDMGGCLGGNMESLKFWYYQGPMNEICAEYVQSEIPCSNISHCEKLGFTTDGYYAIDDSLSETEYIRQVKYSLSKDGPAYFRFDVYPDFYTFWGTGYSGQVYRNSGGIKAGGHAVMLIGWNDNKSAWLCKNSWGAASGSNGDGTFWIAYSGHANDLGFGVANVRLSESGLRVVSPNGKEDWCAGNDYTIQWKTGIAGNYVKIELYNGGSKDRTIAERISNTGSYVWTVPNLAKGDSYRIRLLDYSDSLIYDDSDAYFSIVDACDLRVRSPNGGEKWYMGEAHVIEWDTGVSDEDVKIYLIKNNEQMMIRIAAEAENTGSYVWTIPDTLSEGSDYKILVRAYFDESVADESDGYFTLLKYADDVPPVANAGADKTVNEGTLVTLNGYASDSDGYVVSYFWEQVGGMSAGDFAGSSATLSFTAPAVGSGGTTLTFRLTVTDNDGLTHSDTCVVQVKDKGSASSYTNSLGMTFRLIPAGTFMMGSPESEPGRGSDENQHQVTLTQAFYMQTTEVTQGQWKAVMGSNPSSFNNCGDNCPVETVSWDDIQGFITKINQRGEGTYRLPTEAEWEYSARAGSTTVFANGSLTADPYSCDYDPNLDAIGWYCGNSDSKTHPVAQKQANDWGLYDMSGNVYEWCSDWYGTYPTGAVTDSTGPTTGSYRVIRGGGWSSHARGCRSAYRYGYSPGSRYSGIGFRLVRAMP